MSATATPVPVISWIGEDDDWLNWMGDVEAFEDTEYYPKSQGVNVMIGERICGSLVWDPQGVIRHVYVRPEYSEQGFMRMMLDCYDGPLPLSGDFGDDGLRVKMAEIVTEIRRG